MPQGFQEFMLTANTSAAQHSSDDDAQRAYKVGYLTATLEILANLFPEVDAHLAKLAKV